MPARTDCCGKKAKYCGWNPVLNPYLLKQLSGDLSISSVFGNSFASTGAGVSVIRGTVGTSFLGEPGSGHPTNLYGRIQYSPQCRSKFSITLDDNLRIEYEPGCFFETPAGSYELDYYALTVAGCCRYRFGPFYPSSGPQRWYFDLSVSPAGLMLLKMEMPWDSAGSDHTCGGYKALYYCGNFEGESSVLQISNYDDFPGLEPPNCGVAFDPDFVPGDIPENSNFPGTLSVTAITDESTKLWIGIKSSIGIAVEPATKTFSAVMLDETGNIESTIASVAITEPTIGVPFGAFWWDETGTAQFAVFDQKPPPAPTSFYDVLDYIAMGVAVEQPARDTFAYLGADGPYPSFRGFIQCVVFPACWPQYAINQTTSAYPFRWIIHGFDEHSPCILWNGHGSLRPGELLRAGLPCQWANSWGITTEGEPSGGGTTAFVFDIGLTDPTLVNLRMHWTFTTTPDPLSHETETFTVNVQWSMPIADFDGYIPNTLTIYDWSSDEPSGTTVCIPPTNLTLEPSPF